MDPHASGGPDFSLFSIGVSVPIRSCPTVSTINLSIFNFRLPFSKGKKNDSLACHTIYRYPLRSVSVLNHGLFFVYPSLWENSHRDIIFDRLSRGLVFTIRKIVEAAAWPASVILINSAIQQFMIASADLFFEYRLYPLIAPTQKDMPRSRTFSCSLHESGPIGLLNQAMSGV